MANFIYKFTICLVVAALAQLIVADTSTIERIKKHKEWLNTHNKLKSDRAKFTKGKSSIELANLWRINKQPIEKQNSSINEVYAENETTSMKANIIGGSNDGLEPTKSSQTHLLRSLGNAQQQFNNITSLKLPETSTTTTMTTTTSIPTSAISLTTEPILLKAEDTSTTTSTTTRKPKLKVRPYPRWASWSSWSECSRSCGGGVMHQIRKCIDR
ncbi:uncharacterized protein LOC117780002 [Drosophila innubila]|uniref:uncharacterized protein LOC117780002 n=1 Tax=Drosophila innubila TaxID=198719 RepID=UPI00148DAF00|nr:uncharacterized protein LOC117780002 [Drosophila innubila]